MAGEIGSSRTSASPWRVPWLRVARRGFFFARFVAAVACAGADALFRSLTGRTRTVDRAAWLQRWSRLVLRSVGIRVTVKGTPPTSGMLVSNHLSYLDILVISSAHPFVFVSKAEVGSWPVFGILARMGGTLFVRRDRRTDVRRLNAEVITAVERGVVVVVFPEATSSNGHQILPFHASLLAPAVDNGWSVTPAWVGYQMPEGSVEEEVCYWRDMVFFPHLLTLISCSSITAEVRFGSAVRPSVDRKEFALQLRDAVADLGGLAPAPAPTPR